MLFQKFYRTFVYNNFQNSNLNISHRWEKVLIIGAGGVGTVVANKVAQNHDVFTEIMLASRTKSKCDAIVEDVKRRTGVTIETSQVDADNVSELVKLFDTYKPDIVINVALPYQDLTIMDACLECSVNYLDTANYEPRRSTFRI